MAQVIYIGDEATAAGFRLAGVQAWVPDPGDAVETLRRAAGDGAELLLLSAPFAARLPLAELEAALVRELPLVAVVPDVYGRGTPPDLAHEVRAALGIES